MLQMKLALSLNKDLHVRAAQEKAAEDREERLRKLNMSRYWRIYNTFNLFLPVCSSPRIDVVVKTLFSEKLFEYLI